MAASGRGDAAARSPPARAVRPAPASAAGRPGAAAVRAGRARAWPAAAPDHHRRHGGQHPGDRRADRRGLRRPGAGDHHLLAAVPGRAVGLQQPVTPADPVPRRPDRMADVRLCRRGVRVLGHHRPGHRRPGQSVVDRAGRRDSSGARRPRPDPDPADETSSWRPRWRPSPGRATASSTTCTPGHARQASRRPPRCRRGSGRSSGRTGRPSCSNSTWPGCCAPPAAP